MGDCPLVRCPIEIDELEPSELQVTLTLTMSVKVGPVQFNLTEAGWIGFNFVGKVLIITVPYTMVFDSQEIA